ncbi:mitogen-activated protein kinase kinase kinase 21-like [Paramacrobiotus metropolitanus]|uniref:mitogen-activated protein kinase kinase kinase 21-like n=1 Tax=Paramacrobiotus metropolitanus TaxID=2943436 RepID=UPI0024464963|nr:mitogen-activated protein kinase kinase kinase 21-like [Paramacrobiotus metropolitanus]
MWVYTMWSGFFGSRTRSPCNNRDGCGTFSPDASSVKKDTIVSVRPNFWSPAQVETAVASSVAPVAQQDVSSSRNGSPLTEPESDLRPETSSSGTHFFPSFSLEHCRKLSSNIDFFRAFPKRPHTIPVSMGEASPELSLQGINGATLSEKPNHNAAEETLSPSQIILTGMNVSTTTVTQTSVMQTVNAPADKISSTSPGSIQLPSTSREDASGYHGWFRHAWEASISCITPIVSKWPLIAKQKASQDPWEIPFERIQDLQWLGSGAQGAVFLGKYNGQPVAVKKVKSLAEVEDVKPLRKLSHVNLVAFKGVCTQPPCYCLVMEYCQYGPLYDLIQEDKRIPPPLVAVWSHQIACGMQYLHMNKIIHRDLKSPNVLVCDTHLVKISDFGTMRPWAEDQKSMQMSFAGTVAWMAPEVIRNEPCTEKIDIWAYGVILWELLVGLHPYPGLDSTSIIWGVGSEKLLGLPIPPSMPDGFRLLLTQCWANKPRNRPSFHHILLHLQIAAGELTNMPEAAFYNSQQDWRDLVHTEIKNFRIKSSQSSAFTKQKNQQQRRRKRNEAMMADGFVEELYTLHKRRQEELKHAEEIRIHYEKKLERINKLYLDLTTCSLQLEQRERDVRKREKLVEKILGKPLPGPTERKSRKRIFESVKKAGLELINPRTSASLETTRQVTITQIKSTGKSATLPMDYAIWTAEESSEVLTDTEHNEEDHGEDAEEAENEDGENKTERTNRPPPLTLKTDSIDPVSSLRSTEKNHPKLSPDLCKGLPKRTPSDTLGHVFRLSMRKDRSCQCNLYEEALNGRASSFDKGPLNSLRCEDVMETSTESEMYSTPPVPLLAANSSMASHSDYRAQTPASRSSSSSSEMDPNDSEEEPDPSLNDLSDSDCDSKENDDAFLDDVGFDRHSVFDSSEYLHEHAHQPTGLHRGILMHRSREMERSRSTSSQQDTVTLTMHQSTPNLKDAVSISESLDDHVVNHERRASSSEVERSDVGPKRFVFAHSMPESQV